MKNKKPDFVAITVASVLGILLISVSVLLGITIFSLKKESAEFIDYKKQVEKSSSDEIGKSGNIFDLKNKLSVANEEKNALKDRITSLESLLKEYEENNPDEKYTSLRTEIEALKSELEEKEKEIEGLRQDIIFMDGGGKIDINALTLAVDKIEESISNAPKIVQKTVHTNDGIPETDSSGGAKYDYEYINPTISVYYSDIKNGNYLSEGTNETIYFGEIRKVVYAYALLYCENVGTNYADDKTIDLSEKYVLAENDISEGQGIMKTAEIGTEYSYLELICNLVQYGDETAYGILLKKYGSSFVSTALRASDLNQSLFTENTGTAEDISCLMKSLYAVLEKTAKKNASVKKALTSSIFGAVDFSSIFTSSVGHFSVADGEHCCECVIVYDETPYVFTILSDLPFGSNSTEKFFEGLIKEIQNLHDILT